MVWNPKRRRYADFALTVPPWDERYPTKNPLEEQIEFEPPRMKMDTKWLLKGYRYGPTLHLRAQRMRQIHYLDEHANYYVKLVIKNQLNQTVFSDMLVGIDHACWEFRVKIDNAIITNGQNLSLHFVLGHAYWDPSTVIRPSLKLWLEQGHQSDVTILTKDKVIQCHKSVLADNCEYIHGMFEAEMTECDSLVVDWSKMPYKTMIIEEFLHYLYTGQPPPNIEGTCFDLINLADFVGQSDLKLLCDFTLSHVVHGCTAHIVWMIAERYDSHDLKEAVVHCVIENFLEVENWHGLVATAPVLLDRFLLFYTQLEHAETIRVNSINAFSDESSSDSSTCSDSTS